MSYDFRAQIKSAVTAYTDVAKRTRTPYVGNALRLNNLSLVGDFAELVIGRIFPMPEFPRLRSAPGILEGLPDTLRSER